MTVAADAPILFFDSGVGGLSILAPVREMLPTASIVYAADSAGFPYGTKSEAEIAARVPALLGRLVERYRPRLAVIACNTASTIALQHVRAALDIPVVGTVPAIKPAALLSKNRIFGVLGTDATVRQQGVAKPEGSPVRLTELDLDTGHVGGRRDDVQPGDGRFDGRLGHGPTVGDNVIDGDASRFT